MYILDTCILNILFFYPGEKRDAVVRNINRVGRNQVCISAVSTYELVGIGAVPEINKHINSPEAPQKLSYLITLLNKLSGFNVLLFTTEANGIFNGLPNATKRRGPMDARIAACALTDTNHIVVTEDDEVFGLAGVRTENWARPAA